MEKASIEERVEGIRSQLDVLQSDWSGLNLRARVLTLVAILEGTKDLNKAVLAESGIAAKGARERIRRYLIANVGEVIRGAELQVVGGISDYPRRIRELRVEHGYRIVTGVGNDPDAGIELRPDEYVLLDAEPDEDAARRWEITNRIRRMDDVGGRERILRFLKEHVGEVVTSEELSYVTDDAKEFARRTSELRTEDGYPIHTQLTGRPDLKQGEYTLESLTRIAEPHDRSISTEVLKLVYRRDNNTCQNCGWNQELFTRDDPRYLEVHHRVGHAEGGSNEPRNLVVLCNRCHDKVHAGGLKLDR